MEKRLKEDFDLFRFFFTNLNPGDPGLGLEEVIKLVLNVLEDRVPAVRVVDSVSIAGGVDHSQGKLDPILLQLAVVGLHLMGGISLPSS